MFLEAIFKEEQKKSYPTFTLVALVIALWAAFAVSILYLLVATITLPVLWADPLGPLVKIAPILVLNLVALTILEDR